MATPLVLAQLNGSLAYTNSGAGGTGVGTGALRYRAGHTGGVQSALVESAGINEVANPHCISTTTGWSLQTSSTIVREASLPAAFPDHFARPEGITTCLKVTVGSTSTGDQASVTVTLPSAGDYWASMWVYIPSGWTGGQIRTALSALTGTGTANWNADMAIRNQWQWVTATSAYVITADLSGAYRVAATTPVIGESFYVCGFQWGMHTYGPTSSIPQVSSGTTVLTGYSFLSTAHNSDGVRAATKVEIPTALPGSVALRYSENGTTWNFAYVTSLTGTNVGTRGKLSHDGSDLVIESDRSLLVGPVFAFSDTLTGDEQTTLSNTTTWAFDTLDVDETSGLSLGQRVALLL